ncbi:MAG: hypothetical protein WAV95_07730 [Azonexus sp.]
MTQKNWFKVETNKDKESTYHYYGSSPFNHDELISALQRGEYIHLDDLLYMERTEYKSWADWDKSLNPSVSINPNCVVTVMQYKGDPRTIPAK